jgi:hypothetical protein
MKNKKIELAISLLYEAFLSNEKAHKECKKSQEAYYS